MNMTSLQIFKDFSAIIKISKYLKIENIIHKQDLIYIFFYIHQTKQLLNQYQHIFHRTKTNINYFWNYSLAKDFITKGYGEWIAPVISGIIEVRYIVVDVNKKTFCSLESKNKNSKLSIKYNKLILENII